MEIYAKNKCPYCGGNISFHADISAKINIARNTEGKACVDLQADNDIKDIADYIKDEILHGRGEIYCNDCEADISLERYNSEEGYIVKCLVRSPETYTDEELAATVFSCNTDFFDYFDAETYLENTVEDFLAIFPHSDQDDINYFLDFKKEIKPDTKFVKLWDYKQFKSLKEMVDYIRQYDMEKIEDYIRIHEDFVSVYNRAHANEWFRKDKKGR